MGKKGSWLSALRRVFIPNSKDKPVNGFEKQGVKQGVKEKEKKKWSLGRLRHGETNSFIPLYREPSSVEKILGDAEREQHKAHVLPSRVHIDQPKATNFKPTITPNYHQISAIKIQTAYRGYMARRSFRALRGLVRLQRMVRGQNVKRQTMNAMRCMRLLVKVQTQIHSRRIQMLENQTLQRINNSLQKSDKEVASSVGRWSLAQPSEIDEHEGWDDSVLTKEEIDARVQRKVEAVMKRERALAYAYSHQLWKVTPQSAHNAFMEIRTGVYPWWWTSLERQLPDHTLESEPAQAKTPDMTPPKPNLEPNTPLRAKFGIENPNTSTPRSTKSSISVRPKNLSTSTSRALQTDNSRPLRHMKTRKSGSEFSFNVPLRDDESLTSCPPFSGVPNYMAPTVSAKAKVRNQSSHKEKVQGTPSRESKKRFSFPLSQSIGNLRWNKGSLFSNKDSNSQRMNHKSMNSIGNMSVDSTISLPVGVGRKGF